MTGTCEGVKEFTVVDWFRIVYPVFCISCCSFALSFWPSGNVKDFKVFLVCVGMTDLRNVTPLVACKCLSGFFV